MNMYMKKYLRRVRKKKTTWKYENCKCILGNGVGCRGLLTGDIAGLKLGVKDIFSGKWSWCSRWMGVA